MVKVTSLVVKAGSGLRSSFGVRAWTELEIRCVKGMHRLKLVSCEGFKGLKENCFRLPTPTAHTRRQQALVAAYNIPVLTTQSKSITDSSLRLNYRYTLLILDYGSRIRASER